MGGEPPLQAHEARRILGVGPEVAGASLRRAYLAAVKASHPDRAGGDAARLRTVIAAYILLKSPDAAPSNSAAPQPPPERLIITPTQAMIGGSTTVELRFGKHVAVNVPAGLRQGDRVRVEGRVLAVTVRGEAGAAVLGDHLCLTVAVDSRILECGGRIRVTTPTGDQVVWVSRAAAERGFARATGLGLPPRGDHPQGHLFVRLRAAAAEPAELASRDLLRRFTAAWAA